MKYRLIIFDVDGTLYNLDDVVAGNYNMQVTFYAQQKGMSIDAVKALFAEQSILPYKSKKARSATEFFLKNGIDGDMWRSYRDAHTTPEGICRETAASNELLSQFARQTRLVLLSSNTQSNIENTLDWLAIDRKLFDAIFSSTTKLEGKPFSKTDMIPAILAHYGLEPSEVLSIGDRYETDIRTLRELGGDGVLIHMPEQLKEVYTDLVAETLGKRTNASYSFYGQ